MSLLPFSERADLLIARLREHVPPANDALRLTAVVQAVLLTLFAAVAAAGLMFGLSKYGFDFTARFVPIVGLGCLVVVGTMIATHLHEQVRPLTEAELRRVARLCTEHAGLAEVVAGWRTRLGELRGIEYRRLLAFELDVITFVEEDGMRAARDQQVRALDELLGGPGRGEATS